MSQTTVGSVTGGAPSDTVSTPGSVHNDLSSASTFEDKRRENFSKGQGWNQLYFNSDKVFTLYDEV